MSGLYEEPVRIRPHHGLCAAFFIGKGYSSVFTDNMSKVTGYLAGKDPYIVLTGGADVICAGCPNLTDGVCSGSKAERYDDSVLSVCGVSYGNKMRWKEFSGAVSEKIINAGRLAEICGDCQWYGICGSIAGNS